MSILLLVWKDLIDLPRWLKVTLALIVTLIAFGLYERHVGEAQCKAKVDEAQAKADERAKALQDKLDAAASQDAGLRAALDAVPRPLAPIKFGCTFTPGELALIRERLQ